MNLLIILQVILCLLFMTQAINDMVCLYLWNAIVAILIFTSTDTITNKNVSSGENNQSSYNYGSSTANNINTSSDFNQEINENSHSKTTTRVDNGEVNQDSSIIPNHVILASNLTKMENIKSSLTQITQV